MPAVNAAQLHGADAVEMNALTSGAFSMIMNSSSCSTDFSSESAELPKSIFHTVDWMNWRIDSIRVSRFDDFSRQHPSFNEHGLEEGLCVALLEYDVQNITVTYNATVVATVPWPTLPDRSCIYNASVDLPCTYNASVSLPWPDRWRRVEITLTSRGLSVHYGGELALDVAAERVARSAIGGGAMSAAPHAQP